MGDKCRVGPLAVYKATARPSRIMSTRRDLRLGMPDRGYGEVNAGLSTTSKRCGTHASGETLPVVTSDRCGVSGTGLTRAPADGPKVSLRRCPGQWS